MDATPLSETEYPVYTALKTLFERDGSVGSLFIPERKRVFAALWLFWRVGKKLREGKQRGRKTNSCGGCRRATGCRALGKCKYRCRGAVLLAVCKVCGYYRFVLIVSRYCTSCRVSRPSLKKGGPRMAAVAVDNAAASAVRRPTTKKNACSCEVMLAADT